MPSPHTTDYRRIIGAPHRGTSTEKVGKLTNLLEFLLNCTSAFEGIATPTVPNRRSGVPNKRYCQELSMEKIECVVTASLGVMEVEIACVGTVELLFKKWKIAL